MLYKYVDGSLIDESGKVIYFSNESFVSRICEGDDCFLCGSKKEEKKFNDEHVIPKWLLSKHDLFKVEITLPNESKIRYDKYTLPCCEECNSYLGQNIETEIQSITGKGIESVNQYIVKNGPWKIFLWLCLIFLKTHLKDSLLRMHLDRRKGDGNIGDIYNWGFLHHIHCMVRAIRENSSIESQCCGSLFVLQAKVTDHYDSYDYRDIYEANTILLRTGDVAFLAVLDDSCSANNFFYNHFQRISGPLSPIQLREVLSHITLLNLKLKNRPRYFTKVNPKNGDVTIKAELPEEWELEDHTREELGSILWSNVSQMIESMEDPNLTEENVTQGLYHFLFNEKDEFIKNSMDFYKK